jgi:hypothetical protein
MPAVWMETAALPPFRGIAEKALVLIDETVDYGMRPCGMVIQWVLSLQYAQRTKDHGKGYVFWPQLHRGGVKVRCDVKKQWTG